MFRWIGHLLRSTPAPHEPEPEVAEGQREQKRKFDTWETALREVRRVQRLADGAHTDMHRPHR